VSGAARLIAGGLVSAVAAALVGGCGGAPPKAAATAPPPPPPRPARVVVEDTSRDDHDDGVALATTHGRMDPAAVEAALAPHTAALADCYASRLDKRKWLGGHVALHWDLAADGAITSVHLAESDLGAWPIERCVVEVAREVHLPAPIGGPSDVAIPLDFSAKGKPELWDEDRSQRVVGAGQLAKLAGCRVDGRVDGRGPHPRPPTDDVLVTIYVGPRGGVASVGFASKADFADAWGDCAEKLVRAWRLPDPRGHIAKLVVRYTPH
jgi:hypothetical protein